MLIAPTKSDLARFVGQAVDSLSAFSTQSLQQATFLFQSVSGVTEYPDDADKTQLIQYAIMEMAYQIYLEQPYLASRASPFSSETIGSYSYSKTALKARNGTATGLLWWDLALQQFGNRQSRIQSGQVVVFDNDSMYVNTDTGERTVLGPGDLAEDDSLFYYNGELNPRPSLG